MASATGSFYKAINGVGAEARVSGNGLQCKRLSGRPLFIFADGGLYGQREQERY